MPSRLPRKFDPQALEREYITSDISLRALALRHGVSWSTVAAWARKETWSGKRADYKNSLSRRTYEATAAVVANDTAQIKTENIAILRASLRQYAISLQKGDIKLTPKEAVEFVRALREMTEVPEEAQDTIVNVSAPPDAEFFRRLLETARRKLSEPGPPEGPDPAKPKGSRPN